MNKFYLALITSCLFFSACNVSPTSSTFQTNEPVVLPAKKIEWKEFVSAEGKFKVAFPGTPRQSSKENDTQAGKTKSIIFNVALTEDYFEVRYADFPAEPDIDRNDLKKYYDFIRDNTLKLQASSLLSERDLSLNGKPGRELIINLNDNYTMYRLFLIGNRIFQVTTRVGISRKDDPQIQERSNKFLDSFQIIEK